MRIKLEAVTDVQQMGETKIWELIESIYQGSNPRYIRRLKCYELEMFKGELTG